MCGRFAFFQEIEPLVDDLAAEDDDTFQPSTSVEAMEADSADMYQGAAYPAALAAVIEAGSAAAPARICSRRAPTARSPSCATSPARR